LCILAVGILVPPILKRRGRPKGHELTVIGLPVKMPKKASDVHTKPKLQPFLKLHISVKEKGN